jgi:hypothetical protein
MGVADPAGSILVIEQKNAGQGEIALAPGELAKSPAAIPRPVRQAQRRDDLVRSAQRR